MRRAIAIAVAITLGACNVDVEGARCSAPGTDGECPAGQACGNDHTCSLRAASCVAAGTLCTPGVAPDRCQANAVTACTAADPVCGAWTTQDDCAGALLLCDDAAGPPVCEGGGCTAPWEAGTCPAGQACGNDLRCTLRAAACLAANEFCRPDLDPDRCDGTSAVQRCTTADAVCGAWSVKDDCAGTALACDASSGKPVCEGAPCTVPGTIGGPGLECPGGQACGNDHTCTTHAAGCVLAGDFCTSGAALICGQDDSVKTCTAVDSICSAWTTKTPCAETSQVCESQSGDAACVGKRCTAPGTQDVCAAGQACGNDLRCSAEAAACVASGAYCTPDADRCAGTAAQKCTRSNAICGTWTPQFDCDVTSQVCESPSGAPVCVGKPCTAPGAQDVCATGQRCGNDLRCSTEAATCVAADSFCIPGSTPDRCHSNAVQRCAEGNPVCGTWSTQGDCAGGLVCDGATVACACARPAGTDVFAVEVSAPRNALAPTGAAQPRECRFRKLGDALAAAVARGGPGVVKAFGNPASPDAAVVFAGEALPLDVPAAITVSGADAPVAETVIRGDAEAPAAVVTLKGTLERVHVENVTTTGNGVDASCGPAGTPTLRDVTVSSGTPKLAKGITTAGACGALLQRVVVSGATGPALDVVSPAIGTVVTVSGSKLKESGSGIQVAGGKLVVQNDLTTRSEVTDNGSTGVFIGGTGAVDVTLAGVLVARNRGTGVILGNVPAESALRMTACEVFSNATQIPTQYGPLPRRNAGGLLISPQGRLATFDLQGNQFYANHGGALGADEIAFETGTGWLMKPAGCATANAIGCVGTGFSVSIAGAGTVDAGNTTWPAGDKATNGFVNTSPACSPWAAACPP